MLDKKIKHLEQFLLGLRKNEDYYSRTNNYHGLHPLLGSVCFDTFQEFLARKQF